MCERAHSHQTDEHDSILTPLSPVLAMVREQIPLHASQKRISWSYEPVTRITDISCRAGVDFDDIACEGITVRG